MTIVTELRLKITVVSYWVITRFPGFLEAFLNSTKRFSRLHAVILLAFFKLSLIVYWFILQAVVREKKSQSTAHFATEKKALVTRIIIMSLLVFSFPNSVYPLV